MLWISEIPQKLRAFDSHLLFIAFGSAYAQYYKTRVGRETIDRLSLKVPLVT